MQGMSEAIGMPARRAFWLAVVLALLSAAAILVMPVPAAISALVSAAIAWGVRRGQRWAAITGLFVSAVGIANALTWAQISASSIVPILFSLLCAVLFLMAALDLRASAARTGRWAWLAVACGYGLFELCFTGYIMNSGSMERTLLRSDAVLVDRVTLLGRAPRRDELVVFHYPIDQKEIYLKRVAGIPGDRLKFVNKQLVRNGRPLQEPFAKHVSTYVDAYRDNFPSSDAALFPAGSEMLRSSVRDGELVVPPGKYFVLGDNRDDSLDSRYWGFVSPGEIVGRPVLIYSSYNLETGSAQALGTAFNTRWNRLLRTP